MTRSYETVRLLAVLGLVAAGCGNLDDQELGEDLAASEEALVAPIWDTQCHLASTFDSAKYGDLHSHSSFSDGARLPWELMTYVDNNGGDFTAVTDHANMLQGGDTMAGVDSEFLRCKNNERNTERFAGECGIEVKIFDPHQKHAVILFPTRMEPFQIEGRSSSEFRSMDEFIDQLNNDNHCPSCVGIFAHPASSSNWSPRDYYSPRVAKRMRLVELNGDGANSVDDKPIVAFNKYLRFLDAGHHVSPVFDSDTHHFYSNPLDNAAGAGIWVNPTSENNMRAKLRNAILDNRTFANFPGTDRRYIKLVLVRPGEPENCLMGSTVHRANFPQATFRVVVKGGGEWDRVKIFSNGDSYNDATGRGPAKVCTNRECDRSYDSSTDRTTWTVTLPTKGKSWFVAYVERPNGWVMSSPIWFK